MAETDWAQVFEAPSTAGDTPRALLTRLSALLAVPGQDVGDIRLARERVPANVDVWVEDMTTARLPPAHYDVVTSISALHHVELTQVLPRLAEALRPGGLLLAVALPRTDLPRDLPIEALSAVGNRLLGAAFRLEQLLTGRRRYAHEANVREMPMQDPVLTTRQVREQAARVLPYAQVRRLPFWRYQLRWQRPQTPLS